MINPSKIKLKIITITVSNLVKIIRIIYKMKLN